MKQKNAFLAENVSSFGHVKSVMNMLKDIDSKDGLVIKEYEKDMSKPRQL